VSASSKEEFASLHRSGSPLVMPNPWDIGSARVLAALGYQALATTSSGFAASIGRLDGSVTRDEALSHAAAIVAAVDVPVSADLENGFGHEPDEVAATVAGALAAGLAGCSIEDSSGEGIYDPALAAERVAAAAAAAAGRLVLTARAENHLHGRAELSDTIARLQRYQQAGADVLYAPGLVDAQDIATLVRELDRPVNALLLRDGPSVSELASAGVSRISIGGTFAFAALGALAQAARDLQGEGPYSFWELAGQGREIARGAFPGTSGEIS
jgi:2-methylisocitrate lyase-like PEP mutase family enzyme